jgi:hypothetical protein
MTTLPNTYREQIRLLIDAVDDPTATEVFFAAAQPPSSSRRRPVVLAVAAVLVAGLIGTIAVLRIHDGSNGDVAVRPAVTTTVPASCFIAADNTGGCAMRPRAARRYLGFVARVPIGVPPGWVVERKQLRVYRDPLPNGEGSLPPGVATLPTYNQVWTPAGTDLDQTGTCPSWLQVRERPVLPGEGPVVGMPTLDLGDGTIVYGNIAEPSDCGGTPTLATTVIWLRDGISFLVEATNVDRDHVVRIVKSVDGTQRR